MRVTDEVDSRVAGHWSKDCPQGRTGGSYNGGGRSTSAGAGGGGGGGGASGGCYKCGEGELYRYPLPLLGRRD